MHAFNQVIDSVLPPHPFRMIEPPKVKEDYRDSSTVVLEVVSLRSVVAVERLSEVEFQVLNSLHEDPVRLGEHVLSSIDQGEDWGQQVLEYIAENVDKISDVALLPFIAQLSCAPLNAGVSQLCSSILWKANSISFPERAQEALAILTSPNFLIDFESNRSLWLRAIAYPHHAKALTKLTNDVQSTLVKDTATEVVDETGIMCIYSLRLLDRNFITPQLIEKQLFEFAHKYPESINPWVDLARDLMPNQFSSWYTDYRVARMGFATKLDIARIHLQHAPHVVGTAGAGLIVMCLNGLADAAPLFVWAVIAEQLTILDMVIRPMIFRPRAMSFDQEKRMAEINSQICERQGAQFWSQVRRFFGKETLSDYPQQRASGD